MLRGSARGELCDVAVQSEERENTILKFNLAATVHHGITISFNAVYVCGKKKYLFNGHAVMTFARSPGVRFEYSFDFKPFAASPFPLSLSPAFMLSWARH